jgi:hypothetical protein
MTQRDLIEPAALRAENEGCKDGRVWESEVAASIAISLKRIADAMQGDDQNQGLVQTLSYGLADISRRQQ